ncbi:MAG: hypothetical protein Q9162_001105 [Coniocarpon cinnabarinum]
MDASVSSSAAVSSNEVRQRLPQKPDQPQQVRSVEEARQAVVELNAAEEHKDESQRKTFGRTPNGTVFTVPTTHDMVSQLFSPTEPKNVGDIVVSVILLLHILPVFVLPTSFSIPLYAVVYLLWRAAYNGGIGFVLWHQSNYNALIEWTKRTGIFQDPAKGKNQYARWYPTIKREMETKIPKDYKFDEAPIEYNTWLLFRRVVDLILMADFISYCCFAAACGGRPDGEHAVLTTGRWVLGWALILFNLWVKLDAHRVVKDFAWYWGDFFFLIDQELTFDGVFELAPHPMYSVGYAGYYGISFLAASYKVLFISIVAHAAQFAFLLLVENPHIEKTYNPIPPRQPAREPSPPPGQSLTNSGELDPYATTANAADYEQPSHIRDMIGFENLDLHRTSDVTAILLQAYLYSMAFFTPATFFWQFFFVTNAALWRLWYSIGIGYILDRQSKRKRWTRHYLKWGETTEEAWRQWKGIYHLSMTMCYASFLAASYKMYALPPNWEYGASLLRHVLGAGLILLQLWTVISIYDSLGEFGWFFGDFFFERGPKLTYDGIYRFLNNPERVIGLAGVWGFALITWSKAIFFLAALSHGLTLCFIQFVERPHMHKRYGSHLRGASGVKKNFIRSLPPPLQKWQSNVDQTIEEAAERLDVFLEEARPRIAALIARLAQNTRNVFQRYPSRINVTRLAAPKNLASFDPKDYSLDILNRPASAALTPSAAKTSGREGLMARQPSYRGPMMLEYGEPLRVKWTAPLHHSKRDWVGLYMIADNSDKSITRVSSQGRWIATTKGNYESARADQGILVSDRQLIKWEGDTKHDRGTPLVEGEIEFSGDKYWWTTGVFELRYHHDGMHNVMARSRPFEVTIGRYDDQDVQMRLGSPGGVDSVRSAVETALLPIVRNCFDRDPEIAPHDAEEAFGGRVERDGKFANRVVFAVWQMFGIELAPAVVKADGNVRNLAWRIVNAKQVLAPYSMASNTPSTPDEENEKVLS